MIFHYLKSLFILSLSLSNLVHSGWHDRKCEGWVYFEEKDVPEEKHNDEEKKTQKTPSQQLEEYKKEMEDALALAILEPTEENSRKYLELQNKWLARASDLSKIWAKVVLQHPKLDNSISGMPVSSYGVKYYHGQKSQLQKEIIQSLSNSHSLVCFYEGGNDASKEFAKVISIFSKRHNWIVQPITIDGIVLDDFPNSIPDNGLKEQLGVRHYPAVYVIEPNNNMATPIGFGLISVDMIESNISLQFQEDFKKSKEKTETRK